MQSIWSKKLEKGEKWSGVIHRGRLIRLTALGEGANLSALFYNAYDHAERYNMPDTLKAQHTFHLTKGNILMSDNGLAMASIIDDDLGWHDTISGYTTRTMTDEKYGESLYQEVRNDWLRCGQENFTMELIRNGLDARDLTAPVNFFSKITSDRDGNMQFLPDHCPKGSTVTLRTEMDILMILSNTPNPIDSSPEYPSVPIKCEVLPADPVNPLDPCVTSCPENLRAFENTWEIEALS
ncbi:urea amidolyase associated protein UAAP1 [Sporolactobacillus terrae]|uniref:Urea carboxylase n=1 Tax=Sporolactobacillus terrae TaxID=269673 RepID=A0A5K7WZW4_9BACL|nr:urea amidolyase associated protein UAAP1 [Sporolactobacillus terrae]BBN97873.1 urea carboxylase [Sporolactobacillus terrae]